MRIVDLSDCPEHLPLIGEWIYNAFWQESGKSVDYIRGLLQGHLGNGQIPLTLVSMVDNVPAGTVSLIENDISARPHLVPWLAALYVAPGYRKRGIGSALVKAVVSIATRLGVKRLYLATDDAVDFYAGLGWQPFETDVGPGKLTIMTRQL